MVEETEKEDEEEIGSIYSVDIVIDSGSLAKIKARDNKPAFFVIYWLSTEETKAVATKDSWNAFHKEIRDELKEMPDTYKGVIGFFRGIITPYRTKYAEEAGIKLSLEEKDKDGKETEEDSQIIKIVNRHYATVKYLIVENPDAYLTFKKDGRLRIDTQNITTLEGFYELIATKDSNCISQFENYYEGS